MLMSIANSHFCRFHADRSAISFHIVDTNAHSQKLNAHSDEIDTNLSAMQFHLAT